MAASRDLAIRETAELTVGMAIDSREADGRELSTGAVHNLLLRAGGERDPRSGARRETTPLVCRHVSPLSSVGSLEIGTARFGSCAAS